jgi:TetR/AcrR family transcriptional regulator, regulator of cefoperazone and chloramphenicol sensitivity
MVAASSIPTNTSASLAKNGAEDNAKERLLRAGLNVFAEYGYQVTTTRMLATAAKVNAAAIPYYFGGKEGLYHAVVQSLVDRIRRHLRPNAEAAEALLERPDASRDEILDMLGRILSGPIALLGGTFGERVGKIFGPEQQHPTAAFSIFYEGFDRVVHELSTTLVARYLGIPEDSPEAIIRTHALGGQMFAFLGARFVLRRRLGRDKLTKADNSLIQGIVAEQIRATLLGLRCISEMNDQVE